MNFGGTITEEFIDALKHGAGDFGITLSPQAIDGLATYFDLLHDWNPRLHLVAPCSPAEFATRHVLESLFASQFIPNDSAIVDLGSGGGLPAIPLHIFRQDIKVTMIEASAKKAVFLSECIRRLGSKERATVIARRFESVSAPSADILTCRAIENFSRLLQQIVEFAPQAPLLLFGGESLRIALENKQSSFESRLIPGSERRFIFVVNQRAGAK
jgi:16S rRNA (guanine527-N7)-methyltransferase